MRMTQAGEKPPNINLNELAPVVLADMKDEINRLRWKLYYCPKWRVVKRYLLHERIYKLEGDYSLIDHVMGDDL